MQRRLILLVAFALVMPAVDAATFIVNVPEGNTLQVQNVAGLRTQNYTYADHTAVFVQVDRPGPVGYTLRNATGVASVSFAVAEGGTDSTITSRLDSLSSTASDLASGLSALQASVKQIQTAQDTLAAKVNAQGAVLDALPASLRNATTLAVKTASEPIANGVTELTIQGRDNARVLPAIQDVHFAVQGANQNATTAIEATSSLTRLVVGIGVLQLVILGAVAYLLWNRHAKLTPRERAPMLASTPAAHAAARPTAPAAVTVPPSNPSVLAAILQAHASAPLPAMPAIQIPAPNGNPPASVAPASAAVPVSPLEETDPSDAAATPQENGGEPGTEEVQGDEWEPESQDSPITPQRVARGVFVGRRTRRRNKAAAIDREYADLEARGKAAADKAALNLNPPDLPPTRRGGRQPKTAVVPA